MEQVKNNESEAKLGFFGLVTICISAMVGSAVFDLPKNMATVAGLNAQIIAWITTAIGMWLIAEVFMTLSETRPDLRGGIYDYGMHGFGPLMGFLTAWTHFISNCATNAAFAVLVMNTLNYFFPGTFTGGNNWPAVIGASILTWVMTAITLHGLRSSNILQRIAMVVMLATLVVLIVSMLQHFNWQLFTLDVNADHAIKHVADKPLGSLPSQTMATMMVTLWMFSGIEGAVGMADRAESQQKVHQATLIGFFICLAINIFVSLLALGIFSYGQLSHLESPSTAAILSKVWQNSWGRNLIAIALIITVLASWISWLEMITTLPHYAAIHDGTFPRQFGRTNKEGQPVFGIIVATLVIQAIILIAHYDNSAYQRLLIISSATTIPPYLITEAFLFQQTFANQDLGRHHPRNVRWVAGIAFAYTLLMGISAGMKYTAAEMIVCACGLPLYHYARHQQGVAAYSRIEKIIVILLIIMAIGGFDLLFGLIKQPFLPLENLF